MPELIRNGRDGFLEPVGDIQRQAQRTLQLLLDPDLHRKLSDAARQTAIERFDIRRIIPLYEQYYEEVKNSNL